MEWACQVPTSAPVSIADDLAGPVELVVPTLRVCATVTGEVRRGDRAAACWTEADPLAGAAGDCGGICAAATVAP